MNTQLLKIIACASLATIGVAVQADSVESVSPAQLEQERVERQAYRALLDTIMGREGRDAAWANEQEKQIRASLASVGKLDLATRNVECAQTMCRVVLGHATVSGQQEVLNATAGLQGFKLPGQAHLEWSDDDGSAVTYIYLLRFDTDWPEVLAQE
jgi:hypothetical protein